MGKKTVEDNGDGGKYGKYIDRNGLLERMVNAFTLYLNHPKRPRGGNVGLRGDKGCGKTVGVLKLGDEEDEGIVQMWAKKTYKGKPLKVPKVFDVSAHEEQTYVDWVAQDILVGGETKVREQVILQWLRFCEEGRPAILHLDEANFLSQSVVGFLHPLLDTRQYIWVPELSETKRRSPLHFVVVSVNPFERAQYTGTKEMNAALADRFIWMDVEYMSVSDEVDWLRGEVPDAAYGDIRKLVEFASKTRDAYKMDLLHVPVTPRNLLDWVTLLAENGLKVDELKPYATGMQLMDQRKQVLSLWEGKEVEEVWKMALEREEDD